MAEDGTAGQVAAGEASEAAAASVRSPSAASGAMSAAEGAEDAAAPQTPAKAGQQQQQQQVEDEGAVRDKFNVLSTRFVGFEEQLNARKKKRHDDIERRFEELHAKHEQVVETMRLEKKNNAVQMKALQTWLETRIDEWTERLEKPIHERLDKLERRVDDVAAEVVKVDRKIVEERDKFPAMIDARAKELLEQIQDFRLLFADGQKRREEREGEILADIVEQGNKLTEEIRSERVTREERFTEVNREVAHEVKVRAKAQQMQAERVREDVAALHAKIDREVVRRKEGDEDLAQAVRHYTAALQDSIRIVSEE